MSASRASSLLARQGWADDLARVRPVEAGPSIPPEVVAMSDTIAVEDGGAIRLVVGVVRRNGGLWLSVDRDARARHLLYGWRALRAMLAASNTPRVWGLVARDFPAGLDTMRAFGAVPIGMVTLHGREHVIVELKLWA